MSFLIIISIIILLYYRTYKHENVIDDSCNRHHYLREETANVDKKLPNKKKFYTSRRNPWITVESIITHIISCLCIYMIWGFEASLLYAVCPFMAHCVAWKTGALIYGTSTMFLLIAHYFIITFGWWGLLVGAVFYYCSITVSLSGLPYFAMMPFILAQHSLEGTILFALIAFLFISGKRFKSTLKRRIATNRNNRNVVIGTFSLKRIIVMIKVIAWYITHNFTPPWMIRGGFFTDAGKYIHNYKLDRVFWLDLLLILLFYSWAVMINPFMALWHIVFILLYSQFCTFGMLIAPRYQSVFVVATCVLLSQAFSWLALVILATLWFYRTYLYIKIFRSNEVLFGESMKVYPEDSSNCVNLGSFLMEEGKWNQAIGPLLFALKYASGEKSAPITNDLSICCQRVGQYGKALHFMEMTIKTAPYDMVERLKKDKRRLESKVKQVEMHKKTLQRRGII